MKETISVISGHTGVFHVHEDTDKDVLADITRLINRRERCRIFYGDPATGKDSHEEYDTMGYIRLTSGQKRMPILVNNRASDGGGIISTDRIVRIMAQGRDGRTYVSIYTHPTYHSGTWDYMPCTPIDLPDGRRLSWEATSDGEVRARFETHQQAQKYIDFMLGKRHSKG